MNPTPLKDRANNFEKGEDRKTGGILLLLALAVILSFVVSMWHADRFFQKPIDKGGVQETIGDWIRVLGRFDQDRQARLGQEWNTTVEEFTALVNKRDGKLQETLGQSISHTARKIRMKQEGFRTAILQAGERLDAFKREKEGRRQENLGMAVVRSYRRASEGGLSFELAFEREAARLRIMEARTGRRLESDLDSLIAQETGYRETIPGIYKEAIASARRSALQLEASQMAWAGRVLHELNAGLSWKRSPQDYVRMAGGVREIHGGFRGVGGFMEYGWPALAGLFVAMAWVGIILPMDPLRYLENPAAEEKPPDHHWRKEAA